MHVLKGQTVGLPNSGDFKYFQNRGPLGEFLVTPAGPFPVIVTPAVTTVLVDPVTPITPVHDVTIAVSVTGVITFIRMKNRADPPNPTAYYAQIFRGVALPLASGVSVPFLGSADPLVPGAIYEFDLPVGGLSRAPSAVVLAFSTTQDVWTDPGAGVATLLPTVFGT